MGVRVKVKSGRCQDLEIFAIWRKDLLDCVFVSISIAFVLFDFFVEMSIL